MKVTEGPWAGWTVVGWTQAGLSQSFDLTRGGESDLAAGGNEHGWFVCGPGLGPEFVVFARGPDAGEAGRRAAEAALRAIGIPVGESERDPRVNPEHGDVLRFPDGEVIVVTASSADGVVYSSCSDGSPRDDFSCRVGEWPKWTKDAVVLWPPRHSFDLSAGQVDVAARRAP